MRAARTMSWLGLLAVLGALVWALLGGAPVPVATLVVIGVVLAVADAALLRAETRRDPGLDLPDDVEPPPSRWWPAVTLAGLLGLMAGVASGAVAASAAGAFAAVVGLAGAAETSRARGRGPAAPAVRAARRVRRFARTHGAGDTDAVDGYLVGLGGGRDRLVVVAPDGAWGDVVVPSGGDARLAARLARVRLAEPDDRRLAAAMRTGAPAWRRMTAPL